MKRKLTGIMLAMLLLNGCGNVNDTPNQGSTGTVSETQQETVSAETESKFDYYAVINDINWNGTILKPPFTVDDLGEGYTLDYFSSYDDKKTNKKYSAYYLHYHSENIGMVMREKLEEGSERDEIHQLAINKTYGGDYRNIYIDKIKIGMKLSDVINAWGNPSDTIDFGDEIEYKYFAGDTDRKYIEVDVDKTDSIIGFAIVM